MILHSPDNTVRTNIEATGQEFQIKTGSKAFKILSNNLYKYKIDAVIRELSINAVDSQKIANQSKSFEVHLPTALAPSFSITDFGTGMSEEAIYELYTTYFSSSKADNNDQIGALGLGSKSPFAYANSFNIISKHNNSSKMYSCYLSKKGTPTIIKVKEMEIDIADEIKTGLSISFSVRNSDISYFENAAARIYSVFSDNIKPKIVGLNKDNDILNKYQKTLEPVFVGPNYKLYKQSLVNLHPSGLDQSSFVRMGNILYPLSLTSEQYESFFTTSEERLKIRLLLSSSLIIDVALGSCDIAPSREELSYDKETLNYLFKVLQGIVEDIQRRMKNEIYTRVKEESVFASLLYIAKISRSDVGRIMKTTHKDIKINKSRYSFSEYQDFSIPVKHDLILYKKVYKGSSGQTFTLSEVTPHGSTFSKPNIKGMTTFTLKMKSDILFVLADKSSQLRGTVYKARYKQYMITEQKSTVVITTDKNVFSYFGNPDYVLFSDIPIIKAKKKITNDSCTLYGTQEVVDPFTYKPGRRRLLVVRYRGSLHFYHPVLRLVKIQQTYYDDHLAEYIEALTILQIPNTIIIRMEYSTFKKLESKIKEFKKYVSPFEYIKPRVIRQLKPIAAEIKKNAFALSIDAAAPYIKRNIGYFDDVKKEGLLGTYVSALKQLPTTRQEKKRNRFSILIRLISWNMLSDTEKAQNKKLRAQLDINNYSDIDVVQELVNTYPMLMLIIAQTYVLREYKWEDITSNQATLSVRSRTTFSKEDEEGGIRSLLDYINIIDNKK